MNVIKDSGERALMPPFTGEHEELRESVRRFVSKEIAPHVDEWEEAREFPRELYTRCGELGFLGLKYETEYGGQEELYLLLRGRARFTCDGETVELDAGEMMHVSSEVVRDAVALEDSTLVLCVGGTPGQPYSPS